MNIQEKIQLKLKANVDEKYRAFSSKLLPKVENILGVRFPYLRMLAKEISVSDDVENYLKLKNIDYFEEKVLQAMIIGCLNCSAEKLLEYVRNFVPVIDNWSVCDSFCNSLKISENEQPLVFDFILTYFTSNQEYELRFAYVMLINYFLTDDYIDKVFRLVEMFKDNRYYSKMAVAWLIAEAYTKYPAKTLEYLKKSKLDRWTYNKAIQKICESLKVSQQEKLCVKSYKR